MNGDAMLDKVRDITSGERQKSYGNPLTNHERIAAFWSTYLEIDINYRQVAMMMVLVKVARDMNATKEDNITDIMGYAKIIADMEDALRGHPILL